LKTDNLHKAKKVKNDEFYTFYEDIEKELQHYKEELKNKIIYCNCDDYKISNFYNYFLNNFKELEIAKLITTHYNNNNSIAYKTETTFENDEVVITIQALKEDGDFASQECVDILINSDVIVTNPPFSLFNKYISLLEDHNKKYLVVGNFGAVSYKKIFKLIKSNNLYIGVNKIKTFLQPDNTIKKFGNICWFTNIKNKTNDFIKLTKLYSPTNYIKYENFDAIDVDKLKNIPKDFTGVLGVPITILEQFNSLQFTIIGLGSGKSLQEIAPNCTYPKQFLIDYFNSGKKGHLSEGMFGLALYKNGIPIAPYSRILIKIN
jgi:hypothetical protein